MDFLASVLDYRCPQEISAIFTRPVFPAEIKNVMFSMPSNKAPGSDGYPMEFYRAAWEVIGSDFIVVVQSFFINGFMPRGVNTIILSLIPKTSDARTLKDF